MVRNAQPAAAAAKPYSFIERLASQLDENHPGWFTEWASEAELRKFISAMAAGGFEKLNMLHAFEELRWAVAHRLFHSIAKAAIDANIVEETISERERQKGEAS